MSTSCIRFVKIQVLWFESGIQMDKVREYFSESLQKCLKDKDPYVQKMTAVCVVKLHTLSINRWCKEKVHIRLLRYKKEQDTLMNTGYAQSSYRVLGNLGTYHRPFHSTCLCLNHPRDILTIPLLPYKRSHSRQELPLRPGIPRSWVEWISTIRWKIRDFCIFCGIS